MTAINTFLRHDRGFMMADGAFYDAAGTPLGFGSKIIAMPNLDTVIAARGYAGISSTLAPLMSMRYRDFDDMVLRLEADLIEWSKEVKGFLETTGFPQFSLNILGWSKKDQKPMAFLFTTRQNYEDGEPTGNPSFKLNEVDGYVLCPDVDGPQTFKELPKQNIYLGFPPFDADIAKHFDPLAHGVPIMMAQRRQLDSFVEADENGEFCSVGGHIAVAEVGKDGISQRIVHRWGDEVGSSMKVEDLSEIDIATTRTHLEAAKKRDLGGGKPAMSRQKRRRAERVNVRLAA